MKPFNEEEYNRMCAEFLDIKYSKLHKGELTTERLESEWMCTYANLQYTDSHDDFPLLEPMDYLKFDTDWNWIHNVIDKIKEMYDGQELPEHAYNIWNLSALTRKEIVVRYIWYFLNWYYNESN